MIVSHYVVLFLVIGAAQTAAMLLSLLVTAQHFDETEATAILLNVLFMVPIISTAMVYVGKQERKHQAEQLEERARAIADYERELSELEDDQVRALTKHYSERLSHQVTRKKEPS